jgi:hypothetical protein
MNVRSIIHRAFHSEWVILRYPQSQNLGGSVSYAKNRAVVCLLERAVVTGSRYPSCLPVAAATVLAVVLAAPLSLAGSADAGYWIDTWTASPQPIWDAEFPVPLNIPRALRDQTVRQIARVSIGGTRVRVVLSNEYGSKPLVIRCSTHRSRRYWRRDRG